MPPEMLFEMVQETLGPLLSPVHGKFWWHFSNIFITIGLYRVGGHGFIRA